MSDSEDDCIRISREDGDSDDEFVVESTGNASMAQIEEVLNHLREYNQCKEDLKKVAEGGKKERVPLKEKLTSSENYILQFFNGTSMPRIDYEDYRFQLKRRQTKNTFNRGSVKKVLLESYGEEEGTKIFNNIDEGIGIREVSVVSRTKISKASKKRKRSK
jgi:hypothetical protein